MKKFGKRRAAEPSKPAETPAAEETAESTGAVDEPTAEIPLTEAAVDDAPTDGETAGGEPVFTPEQEKSAKKFKRKKRVKKWVKRVIGIILLLALAAGIVWFVRFKKSRTETDAPVQTTSVVTRGSFDSRVTGSGTVKPIESYTLTSLIEGKILSSPHDQGEQVEKGDILYHFDDTEAQTRIQKAQSALRSAQKAAEKSGKDAAKAVETANKAIETARRSVEKAEKAVTDAQKNIDDIREKMGKLVVKAPVSGMVDELTATAGDTVSGSLCKIVDYSSLTTTVSFNSLQTQSISVGDPVSVGISSLMATVGGSVEKKYTAPHAAGDGTIMYSVKIKLDDGTRLAAGTTVSVTVHTASGDIECPTFGTISYADPKDVTLDEGGEVIELLTENGNTVQEGDIIARLRSEELENKLEDAEQSYQDALTALDDEKEKLQDSREEYREALADRETDNDAVKEAQTDLENAIKAAEDYTIKSPVTGVILEKHYKAGDTYGSDSTDKTLMVVADMTSMVFTINVDELDISNIQEGQEVNVTADALPGQMFKGTITTASKIGSGENGVSAYPVEITVTEPGDLMSGMNVTAEIIVGSVEDALIAPSSAIFMMDGMYYATVVTPSDDPEMPEQEEQVQVTVGLHNESFYEIIDGLEEGDILRDSGLGSDDGMMGDMMMSYG